MRKDQIVLGTPTNGRTHDSSKFRPGDSIWLDAKKPRALGCMKCAECGFTVVSEDVWS